MQVIKILILAAMSIIAISGAEGKRGRQKVVGYLDLSGTTLVIYETKNAFDLKRMDSCISGSMYPVRKAHGISKFVGKKVTAYGYLVSESYYMSQQGDDIAQIGSPIKNTCRNGNVITVVKLVRASR